MPIEGRGKTEPMWLQYLIVYFKDTFSSFKLLLSKQSNSNSMLTVSLIDESIADFIGRDHPIRLSRLSPTQLCHSGGDNVESQTSRLTRNYKSCKTMFWKHEHGDCWILFMQGMAWEQLDEIGNLSILIPYNYCKSDPIMFSFFLHSHPHYPHQPVLNSRL